jgi:hypothetical protein
MGVFNHLLGRVAGVHMYIMLYQQALALKHRDACTGLAKYIMLEDDFPGWYRLEGDIIMEDRSFDFGVLDMFAETAPSMLRDAMLRSFGTTVCRHAGWESALKFFRLHPWHGSACIMLKRALILGKMSTATDIVKRGFELNSEHMRHLLPQINYEKVLGLLRAVSIDTFMRVLNATFFADNLRPSGESILLRAARGRGVVFDHRHVQWITSDMTRALKCRTLISDEILLRNAQHLSEAQLLQVQLIVDNPPRAELADALERAVRSPHSNVSSRAMIFMRMGAWVTAEASVPLLEHAQREEMEDVQHMALWRGARAMSDSSLDVPLTLLRPLAMAVALQSRAMVIKNQKYVEIVSDRAGTVEAKWARARLPRELDRIIWEFLAYTRDTRPKPG